MEGKNYEIRASGIHGKGLYAARDMRHVVVTSEK